MRWDGDFGRKYTARNQGDRDALCLMDYGVTMSSLFQRFLGPLPRDMGILEVGCNIGTNLLMLREMGFHDLTGVDIEPTALAQAGARGLRVVNANAVSLPFKDESFDLVFTSGVLIHIPPADLETVMDEMLRVSRRYIHGLEYWHPELVEVEYRGQMGLMWKGPYAELWQARGLDLRRYHRLEYKDGSGCVDELYLLEKE